MLLIPGDAHDSLIPCLCFAPSLTLLVTLQPTVMVLSWPFTDMGTVGKNLSHLMHVAPAESATMCFHVSARIPQTGIFFEVSLVSQI